MQIKANLTNNDLFQDFRLPRKNCPENYTSSNNVISRQNKEKIERKNKINVPVLISTTVGTLIPLLILRKYASKEQNSIKKCPLRFLDKNIGLKEILFIGVGSIIGGLSGGIISDENTKHHKNKIKESIFQLANLIIPTSLVAGLIELTKKCKEPVNPFVKVGAIITGLAVGMPTALYISNKINNYIMNESNCKNRSLKAGDGLIHFDDIVNTMILGKMPSVDKFPIARILPFLYGINGYNVGNKK